MLADTTLDASTQQAVTQVLRDLREREMQRRRASSTGCMLAAGR